MSDTETDDDKDTCESCGKHMAYADTSPDGDVGRYCHKCSGFVADEVQP